MVENLKPKVSINIISFNRARYAAEALQSVLRQSFKDWELIFIDDASTDDTAEIIRPYLSDARIKYFRNEKNLGISLSRNRALRESAGEFVAILDSDDYWLDAEKLFKQIAHLYARPDIIAVGTGAVAVDEDGKKRWRIKLPIGDVGKNLLWKNPLLHSSVLYRREPVLAAGAYDEAVSGIEDYGLWLELGTKYKLANLPEPMTAYRVHAGNITGTKRRALLAKHFSLLKKYKNKYPLYYCGLFKRSFQYLLSFL